MKEPPCTCTQTGVDEFNADGCMLCNPNSPYNSAISTQLENAVDYIQHAIEELDQAHGCLLDVCRSWNSPAMDAMAKLKDLLKQIDTARAEMLEVA